MRVVKPGLRIHPGLNLAAVPATTQARIIPPATQSIGVIIDTLRKSKPLKTWGF